MRPSHGKDGHRSRGLLCFRGSLVNDMFPIEGKQNKAMLDSGYDIQTIS